MDDKTVHDNESDFIARMGSLSKESSGVSFRDFEALLKEGGSLSVQHMKQVVYFASEQLGFWQAEWLFSPADSPNTIASAEAEGWRLIYRACSDALLGQVSEVREQLEHKHNLTLARHCMERNVDYNKTRPLSRLAVNVFSRMSIGINKLGFESIAMQLYSRSLYPKGTVGRIKE